MARTKRTPATPKHPDVRAREHARRLKVKKFMAMKPSVDWSLFSVTGVSPPNTKFTQDELAFAAASQIRLLGSQLALAHAMLAATAPHLAADRLISIADELKATGNTLADETAPAARHEARTYGQPN